MTDKELIQKLLEHGSKMRAAQKAYYHHPGGGASQKIKKDLLIQSKQAEAEFDNVLFNIKQLLK